MHATDLDYRQLRSLCQRIRFFWVGGGGGGQEPFFPGNDRANQGRRSICRNDATVASLQPRAGNQRLARTTQGSGLRLGGEVWKRRRDPGNSSTAGSKNVTGKQTTWMTRWEFGALHNQWNLERLWNAAGSLDRARSG